MASMHDLVKKQHVAKYGAKPAKVSVKPVAVAKPDNKPKAKKK